MNLLRWSPRRLSNGDPCSALIRCWIETLGGVKVKRHVTVPILMGGLQQSVKTTTCTKSPKVTGGGGALAPHGVSIDQEAIETAPEHLVYWGCDAPTPRWRFPTRARCHLPPAVRLWRCTSGDCYRSVSTEPMARSEGIRPWIGGKTPSSTL